MEMFDAHRRDILNFDNYMDLKKPGFGGPNSAMALRDGKGNLVDKSPKLDGYRRTVERDPAFSHPVYDPTYKAMSHDLVYKQEKKKPFTYDDTRTGIPVVEIEPLEEGKTYTSFERFINEADDYIEEEEYGEEDPEEPYEYPEDDNEQEREEFDNDFNAQATRSNQTTADLRDIEARLREFEQTGTFNDDMEYGANPYDNMESPDGEDIPDWVKELQKSNR